MYDADYEEYLRECEEKSYSNSEDYVTKDSGKRAEHPDGVVRDTDAGKPRFDLMFPRGVPFDAQLMTRVAELYERGGVKYGMRNWEKSDTPETLEHHEAALMRHVVRFLTGTDDGEDHAAAVVWNVNAVDLCRHKIGLKKTAETIKAAESIFPDHLMPGEKVAKLKLYTFPYAGKDTASTNLFYQKQFWAESYEQAQRGFDNWYATQPYYSGVPAIPETPLPPDLTDAELEWAEGDVLEEVKKSLDGEPYTWCYKRHGDIWLYRGDDGKFGAESARSSKKLLAEFGPLRCTKGSHTGRVVDGT